MRVTHSAIRQRAGRAFGDFHGRSQKIKALGFSLTEIAMYCRSSIHRALRTPQFFHCQTVVGITPIRHAKIVIESNVELESIGSAGAFEVGYLRV